MSEWEVQILVLFSFSLQLLLLSLTEWRRRVWSRRLSAALQFILWLLYQLADSTATYTLGHMSLSSSTSRTNQSLMALWAQFLLVHLGGQDTITAYAIEDNQLWLRHLLTLVVQALGAGYVLYRYIAGGGVLLHCVAILMFLAGVLKYGERIRALRSSTQENIVKFLVSVDIPDDTSGRLQVLDDPAEEALQGAHDMFYICLGQFVDYKVWPSESNMRAIESLISNNNGHGMVELVGMQLSLMRDVLYTKTSLVHTRYGFIIRGASALAAFTALSVFPFRSTTQGSGDRGDDHEHRVDVGVTYTLLIGAVLLEMASLFRAATSTWTCASLLQGGRCDKLYSTIISFRKHFKAAERCRKWSGSIGQHDLGYYCSDSLSSWPSGDLWRWIRVKVDYWRNKLYYIDYIQISGDVQSLVLNEIREMVRHCNGMEDTLWSYRGQRSLDKEEKWREFYNKHYDDKSNSGGFDRSILTWYLATDVFLFDLSGSLELLPHLMASDENKKLIEAVQVVSRYMMFLLVERPHLLPSPVRRTQYDNFRYQYSEVRDEVFREGRYYRSSRSNHYNNTLSDDHCQIYCEILNGGHGDLIPGANLAHSLMKTVQSNWEDSMSSEEKILALEDGLKVIFGVWVEMLCYAASHCNSNSHASQLNSNAEFVTIIWIVTTAMFNHEYSGTDKFNEARRAFFKNHENQQTWYELNYPT